MSGVVTTLPWEKPTVEAIHAAAFLRTLDRLALQTQRRLRGDNIGQRSSFRRLPASDFREHPGSAIYDTPSTMVVAGGKLAKTVTWYDNEWGYSCRLTDVLTMIAERGLS